MKYFYKEDAFYNICDRYKMIKEEEDQFKEIIDLALKFGHNVRLYHRKLLFDAMDRCRIKIVVNTGIVIYFDYSVVTGIV